MATIRRDTGRMAAEDATQHLRYDRLVHRVERIAKRQELDDPG